MNDTSITSESSNTQNTCISYIELKIETDPKLIQKSLTWKLLKTKEKKNPKLEKLNSAYRKPIRLIKLQVDNTQEFNIHPLALTKFISEALKDPTQKEKLIKYHLLYSSKSSNPSKSSSQKRPSTSKNPSHTPLPTYNSLTSTKKNFLITDYLDSLDSTLKNIQKSIFPIQKCSLQMSQDSVLKDIYNLQSTKQKSNELFTSLIFRFS